MDIHVPIKPDNPVILRNEAEVKVMLLFCDDVYDVDQEGYELLFSLMPFYRKEKVSKYVKYEDRLLGVVSYALFRHSMYLMGISNEDLAIEMNPYGKPYIKGKPVFFNISHTSNAVACAVNCSEVGVDVQRNIVTYERIMKRVCTPFEIEKIKMSSSPIHYFTKLWTLKESYVKCLGTGIWDNISHIDFSTFDTEWGELHGYYFTCKSSKDYCISVCSQDREEELQRIRVNELLKCITEEGF